MPAWNIQFRKTFSTIASVSNKDWLSSDNDTVGDTCVRSLCVMGDTSAVKKVVEDIGIAVGKDRRDLWALRMGRSRVFSMIVLHSDWTLVKRAFLSSSQETWRSLSSCSK